MSRNKLPPIPEGKNRFKVNFNFTTVRGSMFSGRSGECYVDSSLSIEELKKDEDHAVQDICLAVIHTKKPSYKVFNLTITSIVPI